MDVRQKDLAELQSFIEGTDKEITMILQSLQWDQKHLMEKSPLVACQHDGNHRIPPDKKESHEKECFLRSQGYTKEDKLLPDLPEPEASTVVKLCKEDIRNIINYVSQNDPSFVRGPGCGEQQPLSAGRLQAAYSADERRAIHDAVTCATPLAHILGDLTLPSGSSQAQEELRKSRLQVLAELRDMKRRRVKYRGAATAAAASRNYSHVLRDLIKTQMEMYTGVKSEDVNTTTNARDDQYEVNDKQHAFDNNFHKNDERQSKYRSELKADKYRESSISVDRKHNSRNEKRHRDEDLDRHSRSYSRRDEHRSSKKSKQDTREYHREDRSFKDRRGHEQNRRERERSSESTKTSASTSHDSKRDRYSELVDTSRSSKSKTKRHDRYSNKHDDY